MTPEKQAIKKRSFPLRKLVAAHNWENPQQVRYAVQGELGWREER